MALWCCSVVGEIFSYSENIVSNVQEFLVCFFSLLLTFAVVFASASAPILHQGYGPRVLAEHTIDTILYSSNYFDVSSARAWFTEVRKLTSKAARNQK